LPLFSQCHDDSRRSLLKEFFTGHRPLIAGHFLVNCVDTPTPSCYFATAEKFFREQLHQRRHRNPVRSMAFVAKKIFLTKGVGKHRERLSSFELALRNAGIAACNIVRVSSIFPPNCKLISRSEGLKHIKPGQVAFTVISENSTKEAHRLIAASIGLALPSDKTMYGYLSEHHSFGETEEVAGEYAEELAAEMLATTLNVEFDPDLSWDEKKEVYRISNKIVRTMNVTQSAVGDKRGLWTTVLGAAILIGEDD
jgi:arginine decarboxylase